MSLASHGTGQPLVALGHVGAQRILALMGELEKCAAAVVGMLATGDQSALLQARQRPGQSLRLHALGVRELAGGERTATVQVAEHAELQRRQAARLPLGLEPPAEAHDAAAHGYRGRQRVARSCHRYNDSTYNN